MSKQFLFNGLNSYKKSNRILTGSRIPQKILCNAYKLLSQPLCVDNPGPGVQPGASGYVCLQPREMPLFLWPWQISLLYISTLSLHMQGFSKRFSIKSRMGKSTIASPPLCVNSDDRNATLGEKLLHAQRTNNFSQKFKEHHQ